MGEMPGKLLSEPKPSPGEEEQGAPSREGGRGGRGGGRNRKVAEGRWGIYGRGGNKREDAQGWLVMVGLEVHPRTEQAARERAGLENEPHRLWSHVVVYTENPGAYS